MRSEVESSKSIVKILQQRDREWKNSLTEGSLVYTMSGFGVMQHGMVMAIRKNHFLINYTITGHETWVHRSRIKANQQF